MQDGWVHGGTLLLFNEACGYNLFVSTNKAPSTRPDLGAISGQALLQALYDGEDAAK